MSIFEKVKGVLNGETEQISDLARQHRIQTSINEAFNQEIGTETLRAFESRQETVQPGKFFPEGGKQTETDEELEAFLETGFINEYSIAGTSFYTVTERGNYAITEYEDIIEELETLGQLGSFETDVIDDISRLEEKTPEEYDLELKEHDSGLKEQQRITKQGVAKWRITDEGRTIKKKVDGFLPRKTAELLSRNTRYEPSPEEKMNALETYSGELVESKMADEIVTLLRESLESDYQIATVNMLDTYVDMLISADLSRAGERSSYVRDMRNQITGVKSIYQSLIGENNKVAIPENVNSSDVEEMLKSDMQDICDQIEDAHEEVYH